MTVYIDLKTFLFVAGLVPFVLLGIWIWCLHFGPFKL